MKGDTEQDVDLFANESMGLTLDDFTFDAILGLGETPAATQLVVSEPPSPGTLAAFPFLAQSPTGQKNEGALKPVVKAKEGGFNIIPKAPRVLDASITRLSVTASRDTYFATNPFGAINRMINSPQKTVIAMAAKPVGIVFNSCLVRVN